MIRSSFYSSSVYLHNTIYLVFNFDYFFTYLDDKEIKQTIVGDAKNR